MAKPYFSDHPKNLVKLVFRKGVILSQGFTSVQFSPLTDWVFRGHDRRFSRDPVFSAEGRCEQFWHGQGCPVSDVVHPVLPLPTTVSPSLQGALKNGFGKAVTAWYVPKPCKFPSLDRFHLHGNMMGKVWGKSDWSLRRLVAVEVPLYYNVDKLFYVCTVFFCILFFNPIC